MLAVVGFEVCFLVAAGAASVLSLLLGLVYHGGRHDAGGDCDDGVAQYHDHAGEETPDKGDGSDVAITHRGEGDDCPVDAGADVGELCVRLSSFHHEHEGADDGDENEDEEEIDKYLTETQADTLEKKITLVDKGKELEHTENAQETENSQDEEVACGR